MRLPHTAWIPGLRLVAVFLLLGWVSCVGAPHAINISRRSPDPAEGQVVQAAELGEEVAT